MVERKIYTPSEISCRIKELLNDAFFDIWVDGEISNLRIPSSGHAYFTLKDDKSQIRVVMFKSRRRFQRFELEDGLRVLLRGGVDVYEPRGEYQIIAQVVEPKGTGAMELAFKQLKKRLESEGLFSPDHKKPLPFIPRCIDVVTSPTGAAVQDLLTTIQRRFPNLEILIYPVKVQGEGAAEEIAVAIGELNKREKRSDLLILTRGGGAIEDLWCFNEETVARAIYKSGIPVISAVGHEIDFTIADFVADMRAPTPTAAGELAVPDKEELKNRISSLGGRLDFVMHHRLEEIKHHLRICRKSRIFIEPERIVFARRQKLDDLELRMREALKIQSEREKLARLSAGLHMKNPRIRINTFKSILDEKRKRLIMASKSLSQSKHLNLKSLAMRLDSLSPLAVLGRGYSICYRLPDKKIITGVKELNPNDKVKVQMKEGEITCNVLKVTSSRKVRWNEKD